MLLHPNHGNSIAKPIVAIASCCARAASDYVDAAPPSPVMNARRFS